ncbi:MAG: hypothetical protein VX125_10080 [Pseudomonadota bacterium]|nr:hypothetical protein [Pseudomonadota bacterium]
MKHFKPFLAVWSCIFFIVSLMTFYCFSSYLQQNEMEYCKNNYCFKLLSIGEFLSIVIAIIGIVGVVISLDAWKIGQWYIERKEKFTYAISSMQQIKDELAVRNVHKLLNWNNESFVSALGKINICIEALQDLGIDNNIIDEIKKHKSVFYEQLISYLTGSNEYTCIETKCTVSSLIQAIEDGRVEINKEFNIFKEKHIGRH